MSLLWLNDREALVSMPLRGKKISKKQDKRKRAQNAMRRKWFEKKERKKTE